MSRPRVKMERDGTTISVVPSTVPVHERYGWTVVEDGSSEGVPELTEFDDSFANARSQGADPAKEEE